jgi:pimeloyl-ACP methyl ester carboxylesterase
MILIPGLVSSGDVWKTTVAHVSSRYTCHVLMLPGFAGQPAIAAPVLPAVRDAIAAYIAREKLDHPVVVGHSFGGLVALDLAATHPEIVGPLFIVDTLPWLPGGNDAKATPETMRAPAEAMRSRVPTIPNDTFEAQERAMLATMITAPADREVALGWAIRSDRAGAAEALFEAMTTDLRPALASIRSPAIVIATWKGWPGWDRAKAEAVYTEQYSKLAGVRVVVADTSLHFVMLDDPEFLFAQLDAFLAKPRL